MVKDVHEKINKNPLDSEFIQDLLKEILSDVEQFSNLQKVAQNFELSDEIDEIGIKLILLRKSMTNIIMFYFRCWIMELVDCVEKNH